MQPTRSSGSARPQQHQWQCCMINSQVFLGRLRQHPARSRQLNIGQLFLKPRLSCSSSGDYCSWCGTSPLAPDIDHLRSTSHPARTTDDFRDASSGKFECRRDPYLPASGLHAAGRERQFDAESSKSSNCQTKGKKVEAEACCYTVRNECQTVGVSLVVMIRSCFAGGLFLLQGFRARDARGIVSI